MSPTTSGETTCREVDPLLDLLVDGTIDSVRERAVRGHLRECAACAARFAATSELVAAARQLEALEPPPSLWTGLVERLDADEIAFSHRSRLWWLWQAWQRRLLFGATALVAATALLLGWRANEPSHTAQKAVVAKAAPEELYLEAVKDVERAQDDYTGAVKELRDIVKDERPRWRPDVARAFDANLATIEAAIAHQADVARSAPGDLQAADALAASYRREIDFLQEAVVRGDVQ